MPSASCWVMAEVVRHVSGVETLLAAWRGLLPLAGDVLSTVVQTRLYSDLSIPSGPLNPLG